MGQKLLDDKIGTLSHSAGVISLTASRLTIGGQQYTTTSNITRTITTDVTLTANTLYMVYAIVSGGVVGLRVSINVNSVGPAGFNGWKLVGAFYADDLVSVGFGSFVAIDGIPTSETYTSLPTGSWSTNTTYVGKKKRNGEILEMETYVILAGSPGTPGALTINLPTLDLTKVAAGTSTDSGTLVGNVKVFDSGISADGYLPGSVTVNSATSVACLALTNISNPTGVNGMSRVSHAFPVSFGATGRIVLKFSVPISGWSNTPLKDL